MGYLRLSQHYSLNEVLPGLVEVEAAVPFIVVKDDVIAPQKGPSDSGEGAQPCRVCQGASSSACCATQVTAPARRGRQCCPLLASWAQTR